MEVNVFPIAREMYVKFSHPITFTEVGKNDHHRLPPPNAAGKLVKKTQSRPEQSKKIPRVGSTTVTGDTTSITQVRTGACQELVDLGLSDGC